MRLARTSLKRDGVAPVSRAIASRCFERLRWSRHTHPPLYGFHQPHPLHLCSIRVPSVPTPSPIPHPGDPSPQVLHTSDRVCAPFVVTTRNLTIPHLFEPSGSCTVPLTCPRSSNPSPRSPPKRPHWEPQTLHSPSHPITPSPSQCSGHLLTCSPAHLLPPETFARFVVSALTTLEELSRTSPPNATERRRAATTLLRYLLGPSPRAPRDRTSPHGGGVAASVTEGATRSSPPSPAPDTSRPHRVASSATGFSAAPGGDTSASPPTSPPAIPRAHLDHNTQPTTPQREGVAEETEAVSSAPGFPCAPHAEVAPQETCKASPAPASETLHSRVRDAVPPHPTNHESPITSDPDNSTPPSPAHLFTCSPVLSPSPLVPDARCLMPSSAPIPSAQSPVPHDSS